MSLLHSQFEFSLVGIDELGDAAPEDIEQFASGEVGQREKVTVDGDGPGAG